MFNTRTYLWLLCCLVCVLFTLPSTSAERTDIPIEDLKVYELINNLWDTISAHEISPSGDGVTSFRQVRAEYHRQNAYTFTNTDTSAMEVFSASASYLDQHTLHRTPVPTTVRVWSLYFTHRLYQKFSVGRTQLTVEVPSVSTSPVLTFVVLPVSAEDIIIIDGQFRLYSHDNQTLFAIQGHNKTITVTLKKALSRQDIDAMQIASFYSTQPPEEVVTQTPETHTPTILTAEQNNESLLAIYLFAGLMITLTIIGGVILVKHKRRRDLLLKYSTPTQREASTQHESTQHAFGHTKEHLHHIADILRRRKRQKV